MKIVIMAGGKGTRIAELFPNIPKPLIPVDGMPILEREIRSLASQGFKDLILTVGYLADKFMYLKEKYGVKIVMNEDYSRYNNTSSVIRVIEDMEDTYLCSSDNYFPHNVFLGQPKDSYYSALYAEGETGEYCLTTDKEDNIISVEVGGKDSWYMVGHVFFNKEFSAKFREIMKKEYANDETRHGYWEDVYIRHIADLPLMKVRRYQPHEIEEFDSLDELCLFDPSWNEYRSRLKRS